MTNCININDPNGLVKQLFDAEGKNINDYIFKDESNQNNKRYSFNPDENNCHMVTSIIHNLKSRVLQDDTYRILIDEYDIRTTETLLTLTARHK